MDLKKNFAVIISFIGIVSVFFIYNDYKFSRDSYIKKEIYNQKPTIILSDTKSNISQSNYSNNIKKNSKVINDSNKEKVKIEHKTKKVKYLLKSKLSDFKKSYKGFMSFSEFDSNYFHASNENQDIGILLKKDASSDYLESALCTISIDFKKDIWDEIQKNDPNGLGLEKTKWLQAVVNVFFFSLGQDEIKTITDWVLLSMAKASEKNLKSKKFLVYFKDIKIELNKHSKDSEFITIMVTPYNK